MDDKGGKRGYLGIVAHYVDSSGELRDLPIALPQLTGAHTGEAMAEVVMAIFKQFEITVGKLGYFVLDNAHNNNTTINTLALPMGFSATERRLRCGPHTLNLIGQMLLWGEEKESYDNEETERVNEAENMATWRGDGPLGVLLAVINYIKTPQQYALLRSIRSSLLGTSLSTRQQNSTKSRSPSSQLLLAGTLTFRVLSALLSCN
ncbi:hypothetical protein A1F94_012314 [Pyrenophora tritici-repentis]|nr:hypothetical protein A1F94_012242 [Pyrenophora tritici-repentis]KAG9376714.1 hypothetical protein A1F94_012314 [Pyrenophora tritici-repentis]